MVFCLKVGGLFLFFSFCGNHSRSCWRNLWNSLTPRRNFKPKRTGDPPVSKHARKRYRRTKERKLLIKHVLNLENVLCFARIRATRLGEGFRIRTVSDIHGVVAIKKCANEISKNGFLVCFFLFTTASFRAYNSSDRHTGLKNKRTCTDNSLSSFFCELLAQRCRSKLISS